MVITKLIEDIMQRQREYYSNQYSSMIEVDNTHLEQIIGEDPHKLSDLEADCLEEKCPIIS